MLKPLHHDKVPVQGGVQENDFLITNNILEKCQSGFRTNHITVIALLKILNDIRCNLDNHKLTVLVLLNLTSAFNTVDHHILLNRLRNLVSLSGMVLNWFVFYLTDRHFFVAMDTCSPQNNVWGSPRVNFRSNSF